MEISINRPKGYVDMLITYQIEVNDQKYKIRNGESLKLHVKDDSSSIKFKASSFYLKLENEFGSNLNSITINSRLNSKGMKISIVFLIVSIVASIAFGENEIIRDFCMYYQLFFIAIIIYYVTFGFNNYFQSRASYNKS